MTKYVNPGDAVSSPPVATILGEVFARIRDELPPAEWGGLRQSHLRMITTIGPDGTRITDLAERLRMTKQGAGQLVTMLIDTGLAKVEPGEKDRRVRLVKRTAKGDKFVDSLLRRFAEIEVDWAKEVGPADYATFRRVLDELAGR